ncbi:hypothetical protein ACE6H2_028526 [Prunus campanulata]
MNSTTKWFAMNIILLNFLPILPSSTSIAIVSIKPNQPMRDGDVLLSSNKIFALGFFSPANSRNRYVGVWYNKVPNQTIVWVANRDNPIIPVTDNNASGVGLLTVHGYGGLVIYGMDQNTLLWSANVSVSSPNNSMTAKLLDTGNLVLLEEDNGLSQRILWQGFDHPTNTMLPFMKLGLDRRSKLNRFLTSWKSQDDPGTGNYSFRIDPSGFPQAFSYKGQAPLWRAGSWTGERWSGVPRMTNNFIFNVSFVNNQDELSIMDSITNESIFSRMVLEESGALVRSTWHDQPQQWIKYFSVPSELCDEYGKCGANSNCDPSFECMCLPGYEPKSPHDWNLRDGSGGCVRKNGVSICGNGDGFVKVERVIVPDSSKAFANMNLSWKACPQECLRNCSCKAYAKADERWGGFGCVTWHGDLMDTRTFSNAGQDLYVRVDAIVLAQYAKSNGSLSKKGKLAISMVSVLVFLLLVVPISYWLSAATYNERARLIGDRDATEEGVSVTERINPDGNRVVTEKVGGQVVAQCVEPPLPMGSPGGALDRDAITIGEALEATALSAGDKPIDESDAAAIQAAEMKATGRTEIAPDGVAAMAQYAASVNPRDVNKTKLGDVLEDATQKLQADKVVTREVAKSVIGAEIRNSPTMSTTRGGVAESPAAAARLNQNTGE